MEALDIEITHNAVSARLAGSEMPFSVIFTLL